MSGWVRMASTTSLSPWMMLSTPSGKPASRNSFVGHHGGAGVLLRRLEDEGVSAGDGHRIHPHGHHRGKLNGVIPATTAKRLAVAMGVDGRADMAGELALQQMRNATAEFDNLDAALDLAGGVGVGPCRAPARSPWRCGRVGIEQLLEPEHVAGAPDRRHVRQAGSASLAAATAASSSAAVDNGRIADCSPVAGLKTGAVRGLVERASCPPMTLEIDSMTGSLPDLSVRQNANSAGETILPTPAP